MNETVARGSVASLLVRRKPKGTCRVCGSACDPAIDVCWEHNRYQRYRQVVRQWLGRGPAAKPRVRKRFDLSLRVPFSYPLDPPVDRRRAVVIHIYYAEMASEFSAYCASIPGAVDIYISTDTPEKKDLIERAFAAWSKGALDVRLAQNRGRDISHKLITFADVYDRGYELILFLHSKKTVHDKANGEGWRQAMLHSLTGSPEVAGSILTLFAQDPALGMVFPQHFEGVRQWVDWRETRRDAGAFADELGFDLSGARALDFPAGSMFWARPSALKPLLDRRLAFEDFPPEAGQIDATIAHVIERMFAYSVEVAGFYWLKVAAPECYRDHRDMIRVASPEGLPPAMAKARFDLLR